MIHLIHVILELQPDLAVLWEAVPLFPLLEPYRGIKGRLTHLLEDLQSPLSIKHILQEGSRCLSVRGVL